MQKWEYVTVKRHAQWQGRDWTSAFEGPEDFESVRFLDSLAGICNRLGDRGWELVSNTVYGTPSSVEMTYVFKRPVE